MATAVINKTIDVPNIFRQNVERVVIGESERTALGKLRNDNITYKREWTLETRYLTQSEYADIINHLDSVNYTATDFWLDEFGGTPSANSVDAKITLIEDERSQFSRDGTWHSDGHDITLEVVEV